MISIAWLRIYASCLICEWLLSLIIAKFLSLFLLLYVLF